MNSIILIGRLTRDPDIRWSQGQNQTCVARFTLAVDRRFKKEGEQSADFISCIAFGKTGEVIEKHVGKGTKIAVEGEWRTGSYQNKDGQTVYTNDCVVSSIEFCESKGSSSGSAPAPKTDADGFMNIPTGLDDELPFA